MSGENPMAPFAQFEARVDAKLERIYDKISETNAQNIEALTLLSAKDKSDAQRDQRLAVLEAENKLLTNQVNTANIAIREIPNIVARLSSVETWRTTLASAWTGPQKMIAGFGGVSVLVLLIINLVNLGKAIQ